MFRITLSCVVVLSAVAFAQATQVNIGPNGAVEVKNAKGGKVKVGATGKVEATSDKGTTTVSEDGQTVNAEGAKGSVTVKNGTTVDINTNARRAPAPTGATVATTGTEFNIADNGKTIDYTCTDGQKVGVLGNQNTVTLHGPCSTLSVAGNQNRVTADVVGAIDALGNQNTVSWRAALKGKSPKVASLGTANNINQLR